MRCPRCKIYTCKEFVDKVLIDECTRCGGFWLDAGELSSMFGSDSVESLLLENLTGCEKSPILCPKCSFEMGLLTIQDEVISRKKIVIDMCRKCHGIWLDAGELEHLMIFEKKISKYAQDLGNPENEPKRRGGIKFITHAIEKGRKKLNMLKKPEEEIKITPELKLELSKNQVEKVDENKTFKEVIKEEKITTPKEGKDADGDNGATKSVKRVMKTRTVVKK